MRISDWSSDVCSSDLGSQALPITLLSLDNKYRMIHICGGLVHGPRRPRGGHHSEQPEIKMEMIAPQAAAVPQAKRSEEHTSELQSLMRNSYAVFCLKQKKTTKRTKHKKATQ